MDRANASESVRLVREYLDGIAANTYEDEIVSDGFVAHVPATLGGDGYTFEERKSVYTLYHDAFPDLEVDSDVVTASDETVVVRVRLTGTHDGRALAPDARVDHRVDSSGEQIDVVGVAIFTVADSVITEVQWFVDKLQLLTQLGFESE